MQPLAELRPDLFRKRRSRRNFFVPDRKVRRQVERGRPTAVHPCDSSRPRPAPPQTAHRCPTVGRASFPSAPSPQPSASSSLTRSKRKRLGGRLRPASPASPRPSRRVCAPVASHRLTLRAFSLPPPPPTAAAATPVVAIERSSIYVAGEPTWASRLPRVASAARRVCRASRLPRVASARSPPTFSHPRAVPQVSARPASVAVGPQGRRLCGGTAQGRAACRPDRPTAFFLLAYPVPCAWTGNHCRGPEGAGGLRRHQVLLCRTRGEFGEAGVPAATWTAP